MSELQLKQDEVAFLAASDRCEACGHLQALHNEHCCTYCMIPECRCEWGKVRKA